MAPRTTKPKPKDQAAQASPWEWAFLLPHFLVLKGLVAAADETRIDPSPLDIGRDPETDWWLRIDWAEGLPAAPAEKEQVLERRREALLLTSILADVDYDAWLEHLQASSGFRVPRFMDLGSKRLRPHFRFDFGDGDDDGDVGYADSESESDGDDSDEADDPAIDAASYLFEVASFSPTFLEDHAQAMAIVRNLNTKPSDLHAPRIHVVVRVPSRCRRHSTYMTHWEEVLTNLQALVPSPETPGFALDVITLDMTELPPPPSTFPVVQRILEMNIPIRDLYLPNYFTKYDDDGEDSTPWSVVWASFLRTACGIPTDGRARTAPVSTLRLPPIAKMESRDVAALVSALMVSQIVEHVELIAETKALIMIGQDEIANVKLPDDM